ncbi:DUF4142 domain-containing protein [Mucilaginibacter sp.]
MKKVFTVALLAVAAFTFQACKSGAGDSKNMADSANAVKDSSTKPAATGGIAAVEDDAQFATKAADGGMAEVAYAKLALQKSTNPKIKEFAQQMVTDHTKANEELMGIAKTKNISLPAAPGTEMQKMMTDASAKAGAEFDKQYVSDMVKDHDEDVSLFDKASKDCKDAELKAFAGKTLPTLKMHQQHIKAIQDGMK